MGFGGFIAPCAQLGLEGLTKVGLVAGQEALETSGVKALKKPVTDAFFKALGSATESRPVLTQGLETVKKIGKEYSNFKTGNWAKTTSRKAMEESPQMAIRSPLKKGPLQSLPSFVGQHTALAQEGVNQVIRRPLFTEGMVAPALPRSLPGPHYNKLQFPE